AQPAETEAEDGDVAPEAASKAEAKPRSTREAGNHLEPASKSEGMAEYQKALAAKQLSSDIPLSRARLAEELKRIEGMVLQGRYDEAIGDLVYIVESPRFSAFKESDEGRAARYALGNALGQTGATQAARGYLVPLIQGDPNDTWARRAARSLVDLGLNSDHPSTFVNDLAGLRRMAPEELRGDIAYLVGRTKEREKKFDEALREFSQVSERSRFWAQATYFSGLIEVERGNLKQGERLFCKVADPKLSPRQAPLFGGGDFFRVRDL